MVTGSHGVRMQYDYTGDKAGAAGPVSLASPRWLRLTRAGNMLTGSESTDGANWRDIDTARLAGLPAMVEAGLFVTSPQETLVNRHCRSWRSPPTGPPRPPVSSTTSA